MPHQVSFVPNRTLPMESSNFISKNLFLCSCISLLGFLFLLLMCFNHQGQYYGTSITTLLSFKFGSDSIQTPSSSDHERRKFSGLQETSNMKQGKDGEEEISRRRTAKECNLFEGRWVDDPNGRPLYHASQCPFLSDQVSCQRNGRPDFHYENWRWEASQCTIPR